MFIYLKKWTNLSQPPVFKNRKVDISLKCTKLGQSLVFENRNVYISLKIDRFKSAEGV